MQSLECKMHNLEIEIAVDSVDQFTLHSALRNPHHPPPTRVTISSRSPSAKWCSAWLARGTISKFTSTATWRDSRPISLSNSAIVKFKETFRGWPFTLMFMDVKYQLIA